jgi:hypothetical protein
MSDDVIVVPVENRLLIIAKEFRAIEVPGEWRLVEVPKDAARLKGPHRRGHPTLAA